MIGVYNRLRLGHIHDWVIYIYNLIYNNTIIYKI